MNKRKILSLAMALSIVAIMAVGATLAYFTDVDSATNVFTVGDVDIIQNEKQRVVVDGKPTKELDDFADEMIISPAVGSAVYASVDECPTVDGYDKTALNASHHAYTVFDDQLKNVHDKFVTVTNTGTNDAYVRTIIIMESPANLLAISTNKDYSDINNTVTCSDWVSFQDESGKGYGAYVYTYEKPVKAGQTTVPSLRQVYMKSNVTNEQAAAYGDTLEIYAISQAVQADGFDDATTALNEGHGVVNAAKLAELLSGVQPD